MAVDSGANSSTDPSTTSSSDALTLTYDKLVIAVGCEVADYGIPGVKQHCLFLKELSDARKVRQRIIDCFEAASFPTCTPEKRKALLNIIVGKEENAGEKRKGTEAC